MALRAIRISRILQPEAKCTSIESQQYETRKNLSEHIQIARPYVRRLLIRLLAKIHLDPARKDYLQ